MAGQSESEQATPDIEPEAVAAIVARRRAGELLADIGHDLGLSPLEVINVLQAAGALYEDEDDQ